MQLTKADFHGSLANRFARKQSHQNRPATDVVVAYGRGSAHFRGLTERGRRYIEHFAPKGRTDHATATLIVDSLTRNGYTVKTCGSPAMPQFMAEEVAA